MVKVAARGVKIVDCMEARGGWWKIEVGTGGRSVVLEDVRVESGGF